MPLYLLRKLALAIPAFWAMATLFFLASRLLPGSFAEHRILETEGGFYSKSDQSSRQVAYQAYLGKTGQNLPLFYLSVSAVALPDSLATVLPMERREQLQQLAYKHGLQNDLSEFDAQVEDLRVELDKQPAANQYLEILRYSSNLRQLQQATAALLRMFSHTTSARKIASIQKKLHELSRSQQSHNFLIPHISWHGTQNQYHQWLTGLFSGDFSNSYRTGLPVLDMIWESISNTFWLLLASMLLTLAAALALSMQMAKGRMRWLRRLALPSLFLLDSIPMFVLSLLLLVLLANPEFLQLFPVYGMGYYVPQNLSVWQQLGQWLQYMALPITALVLVNIPYLTSQIYTSIQAALRTDYTRTARAKGLPENLIIWRHALRNALLPLITIVSDFLPALVSGSVIIETVYAIPGVGRLLITSVLSRDYPVLVAIVLLVLVVRTLAYLAADIAYAWADPRVKSELA